MRHKKRLNRIEPVYFYRTSNGNIPFKRWLKKRDARVRAKIFRRFERLEYYGELGPHRFLQGRRLLVEMKFHMNGGYRIYCAFAGGLFIVLNAGDKSSQKRDIPLARKYLEDFLLKKYFD